MEEIKRLDDAIQSLSGRLYAIASQIVDLQRGNLCGGVIDVEKIKILEKERDEGLKELDELNEERCYVLGYKKRSLSL